MKAEKLKAILDGLPSLPGVYLMKSLKGKIVYVGKAKNLKTRVRQYFASTPSDTRIFVNNLQNKLSEIEVVITNTEKEAILLEHNLIQRHMPRYNIRLTDDKRFLCIRLDLQAKWPKLEMIRRPKKDKAIYFGPYHSASSARETLKLLNRHFKLRSCKDRAFANRIRPCLQYQIHRCLAPCVHHVDHFEYMEQTQFARLFLEGRRDDLLLLLRKEMKNAANDFDYEHAASLRNQIQAVEQTLTPQRVCELKNLDQDIIGFYREGDIVEIIVLEVISGRLMGKVDFFFKEQEFPDEDLLSSFLVQRYSSSIRFPEEILVSRQLSDSNVISEVLSEKKGKKVRIVFPKRGKRIDQIKMADLNAKQAFETRTKEINNIEERLAVIQKKLHLSSLPKKMECIDIAHLGGTNTVGAISAVINGKIDSSAGRIFKVNSVDDGNDYKAIAEILGRRFKRSKSNEKGWEAPNLLIIDGGRGQLAIAVAVLEELDIKNQAVVALAKERSQNESATSDRVFLVGRMNPIMLRAETSPLHLLAMARDEAHRLANAFQRKTRRKKTLASQLDSIKGIGPKTKKELLKSLGSLKQIREASIKQISSVPGVSLKLAELIHQSLAK